MDRDGILVSERIKEVSMICARENPIYEQVSSFSIALYVLGCFKAPDVMSVDDIDMVEAGNLLKEHFTPVMESDLPAEYSITESRDRYLMVIGDPLFPVHFAVLTSVNGRKSFFSKLRYFGSGYDTLEELMSDFIGEDGIGYKDIHFFKRNKHNGKTSGCEPRIYVYRNDGSVM